MMTEARMREIANHTCVTYEEVYAWQRTKHAESEKRKSPPMAAMSPETDLWLRALAKRRGVPYEHVVDEWFAGDHRGAVNRGVAEADAVAMPEQSGPHPPMAAGVKLQAIADRYYMSYEEARAEWQRRRRFYVAEKRKEGMRLIGVLAETDAVEQ